MNEQKHSMTGAWALNALDAEEREQVRRYLAEDPEAAAEAAAFEETAAELAGSLPPLAPRPELKAAVMARIGTTRQLSPLPEDEEPAQAAAEESGSPAAEEERAMLSTILASDDASHQVIPSADGGSLQLMYSREQQAMFVQGAGLPVPPEGEAYQLWMIEDPETIRSAGMLEDPGAAVMIEGTIPEGATLGLTLEPAGGSQQPSMDPLAAGVLS